MFREVLSSLRNFRRNPLLTVTAVFCLALGIGGTTAVFSIVDGILLRPLPYPDAGRLVLLRTVPFEDHADRGRVSAPELRDWQAAKSFEAIAGYRVFGIDLLDSERSERLHGLRATPEFFTVLGIRPAYGRAPGSGDPPFGLILGRSLWERRFALKPSIVGQTIPLGVCCPQQPRTLPAPVVGVVQEDVVFPPTVPNLRDPGHGLNDVIDYWSPIDLSAAKRPAGREIEAIAKLKPGVSVSQAQAEMDLIAGKLEQEFPDTNKGWTIRVVPIAEELFRDVRPALLLLMGAVLFVLLIACANVAVLLTFNAVRRSHEIAVKAALGAGARQLIREFIIESVLLTSLGGAVGLLAALGLQRFLLVLALSDLPRIDRVALDARVFAFALGLTFLCGIFVGLIPAVRVLKSNLESTLRTENARAATSHKRARTFEPLLVGAGCADTRIADRIRAAAEGPDPAAGCPGRIRFYESDDRESVTALREACVELQRPTQRTSCGTDRTRARR